MAASYFPPKYLLNNNILADNHLKKILSIKTVTNILLHVHEYVLFSRVYIPQTFQIAGLTFLIPKDQIEVMDIKPEDAMKFILSGGMTSK